MSTNPKMDFAKWFLSLGGAAAFFGADKVNAWASGQIGSVEFQKLFDDYAAGQQNLVVGYVQAHTGSAMPDLFQNWKNNSVYAPVIALLTDDLAHYQQQLMDMHGTENDTPLANATNSSNIQRTQQALAYYKLLASQ